MSTHLKQLYMLFKENPYVLYDQYVPVAIKLGYEPCHPKMFERIRSVVLGA